MMIWENVQVGRIPEALSELVSLCKHFKAFFIWLWCAIEHGKTHEAESLAVHLWSIATQLSCRQRHCECGDRTGEIEDG